MTNIGLIGAIAFSIILILLHFLKQENDPSWRMISEYQIGRYGWLMRLAFFCWSLGVFGVAVALSQHVSAIADILLIIIAISMLGAGIFVTDPISTQATLMRWHIRYLKKKCGCNLKKAAIVHYERTFRSSISVHITSSFIFIFPDRNAWILTTLPIISQNFQKNAKARKCFSYVLWESERG
jgi:hypothetical protein